MKVLKIESQMFCLAESLRSGVIEANSHNSQDGTHRTSPDQFEQIFITMMKVSVLL